MAWEAYLVELYYNEYEHDVVDVCSTLEEAKTACEAKNKTLSHTSPITWRDVSEPGYLPCWQGDTDGVRFHISNYRKEKS